MEQLIHITGMTCQHCVRAVSNALSKVPGVGRVEVSLEKGEARVEGEASADDLIRAVESEGYKASLL